MVTKDDLDYLKLEAKVERELEVERYVQITIVRKDNKSHQKLETLYVYDLPREVYEKYRWVIVWRIARFQCQHPRDWITSSFCYYDKKSGLDLGYNTLLSRYVSAKAQVTRVKNAINHYINYETSNNMFFDEKTDDRLCKAQRKLSEKEAKLTNLEKKISDFINNK